MPAAAEVVCACQFTRLKTNRKKKKIERAMKNLRMVVNVHREPDGDGVEFLREFVKEVRQRAHLQQLLRGFGFLKGNSSFQDEHSGRVNLDQSHVRFRDA